MKNIIAILCFAIALPGLAFAQDDQPDELQYEVQRIYPYISIARQQLHDANTLLDLNERYQSSWVREYLSVEVLTIYGGTLRKSVSKNDVLSDEQKDHMYTADVGTDITVNVHYMPENNLSHNEAREINFTLNVDADSGARYVGGPHALMLFLKERAIDHISDGSFRDYDMASIKFGIDEVGQIIDAHIYTSQDDAIDELLLAAICDMPAWKPAEYSDGTKVKQEFVLLVGSMENCMIPTLNIRRD